jgi:glycogen debranching enzyme
MSELLERKDPFYILATESRPSEPSRVLKHGDTFAVFDPRGDIVVEHQREHGLYHEGTRFLSNWRLRVHGASPLLLSSTVRDSNDLFGADLTNPDVTVDGVVKLARDLLHLYRSRFLLDGVCYESVRIANYGDVPVTVALSLEFGADFADIFEVRGTRRRQRGAILPAHVSTTSAILAYRGLDAVTRRARMHFDPAPAQVTETAVRYRLTLEPQRVIRVLATVECDVGVATATKQPFDHAFATLSDHLTRRAAVQARIAVRNEQFNAWIDRSINDLRMMITDTPQGPYPYAGVPWFSTPFGRDGIITALELLTVDPSLARGVLSYLAATQADAVVSEQDAEPGKILHERRRGEMAALGEVPFGRYYGSVDATPLFVVLAGEYFERTADRVFIDEIWPNVMRALAWIDEYGDCDGDGLVEYGQTRPTGLIQQGWKDSHDSVFHADGRIADGPIALCEVQGYVFDAKRKAARLAHVRGDEPLARRLEEQAERLRRQFEDAFWCDELSTYALALDGAKQPCRVRTSNAGQCLFSGIASAERATRVAAMLLTEDLFSGWGIRTIASSERRYNPMSYHNGSIWPHDNALIAAGFARYGLEDAVKPTVAALFDASRFFDLHRMPELFCGFHRRAGEAPTQYPVACAPQAWASGAVFLLLAAVLRMHVDAAARRVTVAARYLPPSLDSITIHDLDVAGARVDLHFERRAQGVAVTVPDKSGDVEVCVVA